MFAFFKSLFTEKDLSFKDKYWADFFFLIQFSGIWYHIKGDRVTGSFARRLSGRTYASKWTTSIWN